MSKLCSLGGCFGARRRGLQHHKPILPTDMDQRDKTQILYLWERTQNKIESVTSGMIHISAVDKVEKMLQSGRPWVTVMGNAGDGKTTLGFLVLKRLMRNLSVYNIEELEEYRLVLRFNEDRVIMFDDRFGAFTSDQFLVQKWKDVIKDLHDHFATGGTQTKVLFISRKNVVNEVRDSLGHLQDTVLEKTIDLSSLKIKDERLKILDHYLKQGKLKVRDDVKSRVADLDIAHGFPHCAMMYPKLRARKPDLNIIEFFQIPLKFLDITTTVLYNENCKDIFELMIKNDGQFNAYDIEDHDRRKSLLQVEREQEGSYITVWKDGVCMFAHPSIYESVLSVICNKDPLFCVQHATLSVIRQKLTLSSDETQKSPTQINLKPVLPVLRALAVRFRSEILEGDYSVFSHRFCDDDDFCEELLAACVTSDVAVTGQSTGANDNDDEASVLGAASSVSVQDSSQQADTRHLADLHTLGHQIVQRLASTSERGVVSHTQLNSATMSDTTGSQICAVYQNVTMNVTHQQFGDVSVEADTIRNMTLGGQQHIHHTSVQKEEDKQQDGAKGQRLVSTPDQSKLKQHIDRPGKDGRTMLWTAVHGGRKPMVRALLEHGADVNKPDISGKTYILHLCQQDEVDIECVKQAIKKGADCNMVDETGNSPLLYLCKHKNIDQDLVKTLAVKVAPNITNITDRSGMAALHCLCGRKRVNIELVRFLFTESKGDINLPDGKGATPLHWLCVNSKVTFGDIKNVAVEGHGDINKQDCFGFTSLHYLCARSVDKKRLVSLIRKVRGDVNLTDQRGNTPLHFLCLKDKQSADYLLENITGADCNIVNGDGLSVKDHLLRKGNAPQLFVATEMDGASPYLLKDEERKWTPVLGRAMILNSEKVHKKLQVEDFGRVLTNIGESGDRKSPGQFSRFKGTCSSLVPLNASPLTTAPSYWETVSRLKWKGVTLIMLQMGLVQGRWTLDEGHNVSAQPGSVCVSVGDFDCLRLSHRNRLCIRVLRCDLARRSKQVGECVTLSRPLPGAEFTFTFGLVLDVRKRRVGFIYVERGQLLCIVNLELKYDVIPMFYVDPDNDCCDTRMKLVSGREICLTDKKIELIQQALSD